MVDKEKEHSYTNCTNISNTVGTEREGAAGRTGAQGAAETAREGCCADGEGGTGAEKN